ncbi:UPF0160 protein-like isoform X2 [Varroa jacobsoni]|uniref:UPF0160 protein-like isoform X2 n=1 Tax=Varroa jacobsoni TaxID=62625 RepID=UPI000BF34EA3|nr:UPF0160 protein-like isoform X2 [Varroa jacobsoni]
MKSAIGNYLLHSLKIATHDGTFHCDDALAVYLLKQLPKFRNAEIIRTRDRDVMFEADARVDVCGIYDTEKWCFDHHQPSFKLTMADLRPGLKQADIKLSSAGLVYHNFGEEIIASQMKIDSDDPAVKKVWRKVYENFIREVDAIDNGIEMCEGEPKYRISTGLSSRVAHLNPRWNENQTPEELLLRFHKAVKLVGKEFYHMVDFYAKSWIPSRVIVEKAIVNRKKEHDTGEIAVLHEGVCPWKDHLFEIEEELGIKGEIKFVVYRDITNSFRVQAVPIKEGSFTSRKFHRRKPNSLRFLEPCSHKMGVSSDIESSANFSFCRCIEISRKALPWKGKREDDLNQAVGIKGCIFVHNSGFIGGHQTLEGALIMAKKALLTSNANGNGKKASS